MPAPSTSSSRSISSTAVCPVSMHSNAWWQVADSAQPPPTQPATTRPCSSTTALDAVLADTEPTVSTTVATANGLPLARRSWITSKISVAINQASCRTETLRRPLINFSDPDKQPGVVLGRVQVEYAMVIGHRIGPDQIRIAFDQALAAQVAVTGQDRLAMAMGEHDGVAAPAVIGGYQNRARAVWRKAWIRMVHVRGVEQRLVRQADHDPVAGLLQGLHAAVNRGHLPLRVVRVFNQFQGQALEQGLGSVGLMTQHHHDLVQTGPEQGLGGAPQQGQSPNIQGQLVGVAHAPGLARRQQDGRDAAAAQRACRRRSGAAPAPCRNCADNLRSRSSSSVRYSLRYSALAMSTVIPHTGSMAPPVLRGNWRLRRARRIRRNVILADARQQGPTPVRRPRAGPAPARRASTERSLPASRRRSRPRPARRWQFTRAESSCPRSLR